MIMRDTIEQTLYERNKRKHAAEVSLNITEDSANNNFGVQVSFTPDNIEPQLVNFCCCLLDGVH